MPVSYTPSIFPSNKDRQGERERAMEAVSREQSERNERWMKSVYLDGKFSCFVCPVEYIWQLLATREGDARM